MKTERPLRVVFFKTEADNEPVREWLKTLPKEDCKTIGADILTVQFAWPVGKPLVDNLGDGIWEVRSRLNNRIARTLFAVVDEEIVLFHGFIKKQQKTPPDELDLAKKRKRQYLETYEQKNPSRK
ncbi:MAG: type II toxin-antitoxin system RelE/ParE family toxin [Verrucomicrobia bacterium]|nr:type II toxin-antitoxin system RelE/ParE family toxin [Verrucomicrobiota bacterium]